MKRHPPSLSNTLIKSLILPGLVAAVLGAFIVYVLVKEEYDELQDFALTSKAYLVLQVLNEHIDVIASSADETLINPLSFENALLPEGELTMFWLVGPSGDVILKSPRADDAVFRARSETELVTAQGHRIAAVTAPNTPPCIWIILMAWSWLA